jgi:hypothetical protein
MLMIEFCIPRCFLLRRGWSSRFSSHLLSHVIVEVRAACRDGHVPRMSMEMRFLYDHNALHRHRSGSTILRSNQLNPTPSTPLPSHIVPFNQDPGAVLSPCQRLDL